MLKAGRKAVQTGRFLKHSPLREESPRQPRKPPTLPLSSTHASVITIARSAALHVPQIVSRLICTAVRTSIATPVGPVVLTVAVQIMPAALAPPALAALNSIAKLVSAIGRHSAMRSLAFFAGWMPETQATPSKRASMVARASITAQ